MKKSLFSLLALLLALGAGAQKTTATRTLSSFDKIAVSGGFDKVLLQEGSAESITLELSGIDADNIKTEVKGNTLEIGVKKGWYGDFKATLTVTYRSINAVSNSGSSDVELLSTVKGDAFTYRSSGSGDFKGAFEVKKLEARISGSADMTLSGNADEQKYAISGSGDINAAALKGKSAEVSISGSGDVDLNVEGSVRANVSGSGDVKNKG
jgi:predicted ATPase